jgi:hypothetical protein
MAVKKIICRQQAVRDAGKLAVFPPLYIQHVIEDRAATCLGFYSLYPLRRHVRDLVGDSDQFFRCFPEKWSRTGGPPSEFGQ